MVRRPLLTSGAVGTLVGATLVIYMVVEESDLSFPHILVFGVIVGFAVFVAALLVLWLADTVSRSNG